MSFKLVFTHLYLYSHHNHRGDSHPKQLSLSCNLLLTLSLNQTLALTPVLTCLHPRPNPLILTLTTLTHILSSLSPLMFVSPSLKLAISPTLTVGHHPHSLTPGQVRLNLIPILSHSYQHCRRNKNLV